MLIVGFTKMNRMAKRVVVASVAILAPIMIMLAAMLIPGALRRAEEAQCGRERAVARLLIGYLRQHPNSWPSGWSDLRASMDPQLVNADECISVWRQRVDVNWLLSPRELVGATNDSMPQAIRYRDPSAYGRVAARTPEGKREPDPNVMIWQYANKTEANNTADSYR